MGEEKKRVRTDSRGGKWSSVDVEAECSDISRSNSSNLEEVCVDSSEGSGEQSVTR